MAISYYDIAIFTNNKKALQRLAENAQQTDLQIFNI